MVKDRQWLKIRYEDDDRRSWHIAKDTVDDAGFTVVGTLCGLKPRYYDLRNERPGNEATCESCFRVEDKD